MGLFRDKETNKFERKIAFTANWQLETLSTESRHFIGVSDACQTLPNLYG